ncbi:hypothetical protein Y032_0387g467 [Ancylostoma ceylanicum]|uniref:Uncharacterized protein n=1 Tax=Ancylostoma ceylanicum TaxID=53326 RepID=A0A016RT49_9BILA|nr:hypothetical protein Y032_0387g467 [Ancylostoma ceylanicum]
MQISAISAECTMDPTLREKITSRHKKFHPASDRPNYHCRLEDMAKNYLDPHSGFLLDPDYGVIKAV